MATKLTPSEIRAIQALIGTEPTRNLAVRFGVHDSTIRKWTQGLPRARVRYGVTAVSDRALLSMSSRLSQAEIARQFGVSRASIHERIKRIKEAGAKSYDVHVAQKRGGFWRRTRPADQRPAQPQAQVHASP